MFCPNCGISVGDQANFCSSCGERLPKKENPIDFERILVVDDEPTMRDYLVKTLKRNKYRLDSAGGGAEAIEKVKSNSYNLVLTNLRMPEVSGYEVIKFVKKHSVDTEVILFTASTTIEYLVEAMKLGAYDYFCTPVSADEVLLLVKRVFEYKRLREENRTLRNENNQALNQLNTKSGVEGITLGMTLREVEKRYILSTLDAEKNNRCRASEILGISIRVLRNKLNEYGKEGIIKS